MSSIDFYDLSNLKPLDLDKVAKQLKLSKRGAEAGEAEQPPVSAKEFDDNERDIIGRLQGHRADVRADHAKRLQALEGTIAAQKSKVLSELHIADARNQFTALKQDLKSNGRLLAKSQENFNAEKSVLNSFRQKHNITNFPPPEKGLLDKFAILIAFVVLEALANLFFFAEGNEFGIIGGYLIAVAISVFNVFLFYFIGVFFLKFVSSVSWPLKVVGLVSWILTLATLPIFHGLIAFFRHERIEKAENQLNSTSGDLTKSAWENLKNLNFEILANDLASIALFVVGVGFGLYAAYKGFTKGHAYPGYDRRYKIYQSFERELEKTEQGFRGRFVQANYDVSKQLKGIMSNQSSVKASLQKLGQQKVDIIKRVDEVDEELGENCNLLLSRYRAANRTARSTPAPAYFDSLFVPRDQFGAGTKGKDYTALKGLPEKLYDIAGADQKASALLAEIEALGVEMDMLLSEDQNV